MTGVDWARCRIEGAGALFENMDMVRLFEHCRSPLLLVVLLEQKKMLQPKVGRRTCAAFVFPSAPMTSRVQEHTTS